MQDITARLDFFPFHVLPSLPILVILPLDTTKTDSVAPDPSIFTCKANG